MFATQTEKIELVDGIQSIEKVQSEKTQKIAVLIFFSFKNLIKVAHSCANTHAQELSFVNVNTYFIF